MNNQTLVFGVMKQLPNFVFTAQSAVSRFFGNKGITDFYAAIRYLKQLPTTQERSSPDLLQIAEEGGSRCAKTALLAALAQENYHQEVKLVLCTYTENFETSPLVQCLLEKYNLPALPATACFLKYQDDFYCPFQDTQPKQSSVLSDIEIAPVQIGSFTQRYCHHFIKHWLMIEKLHQNWTVDKIKQVKQECRQLLEKQTWQSGQTSFED